MNRFIFLLVFLPLLSHAQSIFDDFDTFLKDHSVFGAVDYAAIRKDPIELNNIVQKIATYSVSDQSADHQKAFYINAYNILVIHQVVQNYPIASPMDVDGFFKVNTFPIAGEVLTLDQIEFDKLLKDDIDPRVHFALACAAKGCPYLFENAFTPEQLEAQLNFRASQIIGLASYVYVDDASQSIQVSKIFDWYQSQFLTVSETLIDYINLYREEKISQNYRLTFGEYDWSLNDR